MVQQKLKDSNKELETYIYKTSHDLKAPLSSILGLAQIAKTETDDVESQKYFDLIGDMTKKLDSKIVELVKSMNIKDTGKFEDKIDIELMIHDLLDKVQFMNGFKRVKIEVNTTLQNPIVSNKIVLESIIQNLVENAVKYQDYKKKNPYLKICISKAADTTKLFFEDNGIGIEKSMQDHIFEMYYRATTEAKGSGLGLYLVKKGVEKLNGDIHLESKFGEGTSFTILLDSVE